MTTVARIFSANPHTPATFVMRHCAVFVDGRSQKEVAEQFGVAYGSLRQWVHELREHSRQGTDKSPFFKT